MQMPEQHMRPAPHAGLHAPPPLEPLPDPPELLPEPPLLDAPELPEPPELPPLDPELAPVSLDASAPPVVDPPQCTESAAATNDSARVAERFQRQLM
jgi:hypothetical protein